MARTFGQPVPLDRTVEPANTQAAPAAPIPRVKKSRFAQLALVTGATLSLFWVGVGCAFVWGWLGAQVLAQPLSA